MTTENNKIIAEFMTLKLNPETINSDFIQCQSPIRKDKSFETICFHSNWNWLMEVVEKISTDAMYYLALDDVKSSNWNKLQLGLKGATVGNISLVYNACLEFINWYNEQKK